MAVAKANPKVFVEIDKPSNLLINEGYELTEIPEGKQKPSIRGKAKVIGYCEKRDKYVATCDIKDHRSVQELGRIGWRFDKLRPNTSIGFWLHDGQRLRSDKWGTGESCNTRS